MKIIVPAGVVFLMVLWHGDYAGGTCRFRIHCRPDSATVILDSVARGVTPLTLKNIIPGRHSILIRKKGYFVKKINAVAHADSSQEFDVVLLKPGGLVIKTEPEGARCLIDNKDVGTTPFEDARLKPGDYALRLELTTREPLDRRVTVAEGRSDTLSFDLPFTKSYLDSTFAVKKQLDDKRKKAKKIAFAVVVGIFALFIIGILGVETTSAK